MSIPYPNESENKNEFISRCVSSLTKNDPERKADQIAAICYNSFDAHNKKLN